MKKPDVARVASRLAKDDSEGGASQSLPNPKEQRSTLLNNATPVMEQALSGFPNDLQKQISYFFTNFRIPASKGRKRSVSVLTTRKYVYAVYAFTDALRATGIKIENLNDLTAKHPKIVFQHWEEKGMSASTLTTYFSCIKRTYEWLGKPLKAKSAKELVRDKGRVVRHGSITKSKSWTEGGVDLHNVISKVEAMNSHAALYLQLCIAFGLRVQEAIALRPLDSHQGTFLEIKLGAKGGRGRVIPYENSYQTQVIEKALAMADSRTGLIRPSGFSMSRAKSSFYHYLHRAGVTTKELGVTAHGLRHEYAADTYEHHSGQPAPVAGGAKIDLAVDRAARKHVTEALGHSRLSITSAYLGSIPGMARARRNHLANLNTQMSGPQSHLTLAYRAMTSEMEAQLKGAVDVRVWVVGVEANGQFIEKMPLMMCAGVFHPNGLKTHLQLSDAQLRTLADAAGKDTGRRCAMEEDARIGAAEDRFELMLMLDTPSLSAQM